jgi:hypothetical protein
MDMCVNCMKQTMCVTGFRVPVTLLVYRIVLIHPLCIRVFVQLGMRGIIVHNVCFCNFILFFHKIIL